MPCFQCKNAYAPNLTHCPHCGYPAIRPIAPPPSRGKIIGLIALGVCISVGFTLAQFVNAKDQFNQIFHQIRTDGRHNTPPDPFASTPQSLPSPSFSTAPPSPAFRNHNEAIERMEKQQKESLERMRQSQERMMKDMERMRQETQERIRRNAPEAPPRF